MHIIRARDAEQKQQRRQTLIDAGWTIYLESDGQLPSVAQISARAGYQFGATDAYGLSGGVGLKYETGSFYGQLDYSVRPHSTLGLVNQITAAVRFQ